MKIRRDSSMMTGMVILALMTMMARQHGFCTGAWLSSSSSSHRASSRGRLALLQAASLQQTPSPHEQQQQQQDENAQRMRADIEALRKEAAARLEALTLQMDQLQATVVACSTTTTTEAASALQAQQQAAIHASVAAASSASSTTTTDVNPVDSHTRAVPNPAVSVGAASDSVVGGLKRTPDLNLLDGTQWKIALNVGREQGTWMPNEWAASGERLLFQMEVEFTDIPAYHEKDASYYKDEFFQGLAGTKLLKVQDAYQVPRGLTVTAQRDEHQHVHYDHSFGGRRPLKVRPLGAYKVCPGQGPMGTDLVRFFVEIQEDVVHHDVSCTAGRVYGTCGYFDAKQWAAASSTSSSVKETLAKDYHKAAAEYEKLKFEMENDQRLVSWDHVTKWRQMKDLSKTMDQIHHALQEARQRQPEKSQLRFVTDPHDKNALVVALSREGGLCRKVHKGWALEYHILGRMEMAHAPVHEPHHEEEEPREARNKR